MDELSAFAARRPMLLEQERELLQRADLVFTGGHSLYEAKRHLHRNVHPFPSSVDVAHFGPRAEPLSGPEDQAAFRTRASGFFGVLDERLDTGWSPAIADARPTGTSS